jgi:hypothetical protein
MAFQGRHRRVADGSTALEGHRTSHESKWLDAYMISDRQANFTGKMPIFAQFFGVSLAMR